MWISRKAFTDMQAGWSARQRELQLRIDTLELRLGDVQRLRATEIAEARGVERQLTKQIITMIGDTRAAQMRADLVTIQLNQLQEERVILLNQALSGSGGFAPKVPHIGPAARTVEPGTSFEDMGDEQAAASGLIPEPDPWPMGWSGPKRADKADEGLEVGVGFTGEESGLPGTVYTPTATPPKAGY